MATTQNEEREASVHKAQKVATPRVECAHTPEGRGIAAKE